MHFLEDFFQKLKDHFFPSTRNVYRPHLLRRPWLIFFLAIILTAEGVFVADLIMRQSAFNFLAAVLPGEVIALTNNERVVNNVGEVSENAYLNAAAQAKANDMAAKGYFSHVGPDGKEPWGWVSEAGYAYQSAGENLAVRFADSSEVVEAWMASPSHRANIIKPTYQEIGVGVAQGTFQDQQATFVVQYFGAPLGAASVAAPQASLAVAPAAPEEVVTSVPLVQGAETQVVTPLQQNETPWSSFARELVRGDVRPSVAVLWVLGGVASLLIMGLALAFFVHIQVQATDMLVGGAVVAVMAISFLALNLKTPFVSSGPPQTAAVFGALPTSGGFIDATAAASVVAR